MAALAPDRGPPKGVPAASRRYELGTRNGAGDCESGPEGGSRRRVDVLDIEWISDPLSCGLGLAAPAALERFVAAGQAGHAGAMKCVGTALRWGSASDRTCLRPSSGW